MSTETHPAVSDAMREAVALTMKRILCKGACLTPETCAVCVPKAKNCAGILLAPSGPIASETARLTGERDAAREDAERQKRHGIERHQAWARTNSELFDAKKATLTAEAETARLRAALEPFVREADRITPAGSECGVTIGDRVQVWQSGPVEITRSRITYGDLRQARAALSSQEKTDA